MRRFLIFLVAALCGLSASLTGAEPMRSVNREKVLHAFSFNDGAEPTGVVFDTAGNLYGSTFSGGNESCPGGCGTVFKLAPGTNGKWTETLLHSFRNNQDGYAPDGTLIFDALGNLYGTTNKGADPSCSDGCGTVFRLSPDTDGKWTITVLHAFNGKDGYAPIGPLTLDSSGNLYGTTSQGGVHCLPSGCGVVFKLAVGTNGQWTETVLHSFNGHNGWYPASGVIFDAVGNLYGSTYQGGDLSCGVSDGCGLVFKLAPGGEDQWTETVLHVFSLHLGLPQAGLIFDGAGNLYGTTTLQGADHGTVYMLAPSAKGRWVYTVLHSFEGKPAASPSSGVILDAAGNLYGMTLLGGNPTCTNGGCGTVFKLTRNDAGRWSLMTLHAFDEKDGWLPLGGLIFDSEGDLYGTTVWGGHLTDCSSNGCGVVFQITPP